MKNDIDAQFLCKDCDRYNQCRYYHNRKEDSYICKYFEFHLAVPDKEPCEDAISREDALDILEDYDHDRDEHKENAFADARARMVDLPPVTPIRPKGEWETGYTYPDGEYWKCSVCKELIRVRIPMHFCPNCSADMRGEKDAT